MTTSDKETVSGRARPKTSDGASDSGVSASADGGENLTQIREILFGPQMEAYDDRFSRLEERITSVAGSLQTEFVGRLGELEAGVQRELQALAKDLRSEHEKRAAGIEKEFERARSDLQSGLDALREQFTAQAQSIRDELEGKHRLVTEMITREAADIRGQKVDRTTLAALLKEVASQLDSEPESKAAAQEG